MTTTNFEYRVAYDLIQAGYQNWLQAIPGTIIGIVGLVMLMKRVKSHSVTADLKNSSISIFMIIFGMIWVAAFAGNYSIYAGLRDSVMKGGYETVEGRVSNFVPMPYEGHAQEHFDVNGKKFSYSDYDLTKGFNKTKSHGGPIREGLQVRINYVGESIVKLEIADDLTANPPTSTKSTHPPSLENSANKFKAHPEVFPWFMGTWAVLGVISSWLFFLSKNISLKKRLLPIFNIGTGILFVGFVFLMTGQPRIMLFVIPAVIVISILNHRMIRVCDSCGRTVTNNVWFSKMEFCSKCGAKLQS